MAAGQGGYPDEVASAALFLASDEPSFIAGVDLPLGCADHAHFVRRIDVAIAASRSFLQRYRNESAPFQQARFIIHRPEI
jgi:hypothetical protein